MNIMSNYFLSAKDLPIDSYNCKDWILWMRNPRQEYPCRVHQEISTTKTIKIIKFILANDDT